MSRVFTGPRRSMRPSSASTRRRRFRRSIAKTRCCRSRRGVPRDRSRRIHLGARSQEKAHALHPQVQRATQVREVEVLRHNSENYSCFNHYSPLATIRPVWPGSKPTLASTLERQDRQVPVVNGRKGGAVTAMERGGAAGERKALCIRAFAVHQLAAQENDMDASRRTGEQIEKCRKR